MRNSISTFFGIAAVAMMIFFTTSCKDECKDVVCMNAGECVEGDCVCAAGYEGTDCGTAINAKFAGSFNLSEICDTGSDSYAVTVTVASGSATGIVLNNLYAAGVNTTATVNNAGSSFTIASQPMNSGTVSGTGSISADGVTITVNYTFVGTGTDGCVSTLTRL